MAEEGSNKVKSFRNEKVEHFPNCALYIVEVSKLREDGPPGLAKHAYNTASHLRS